MPTFTAIYGEQTVTIEVETGCLMGDAVVQTGLPLEQPCAGLGTCGKCKLLVEEGAMDPDPLEEENLSEGEIRLGNRLACRARVQSDTRVVLAPIVVYSNKIFRSSSRYKREREAPLGLAIDLGTTTVAAFLTMLEDGDVCAGAATLNRQTVYGADVISRIAAAEDPVNAGRLKQLAVASINQAVDALALSARVRERIQRVVVVGNVAMHHLLARLPIDTLAEIPFQPYQRQSILEAGELLGGIFPAEVQVRLPPLIGGFVGSDALACLAYFGFPAPGHPPPSGSSGPALAIDLGTNGEVLATDGERILTASTAAGPAFEGVNISCGTRAVEGAVVSVQIQNGEIELETIGDEAPTGITGSGLLSLVHAMRGIGLVEVAGQFAVHVPGILTQRMAEDRRGVRRVYLTADHSLYLTQWDVRELQKAKGAIRTAAEILLAQLGVAPGDLERVILTGSFGGQLDIDATLALGLLPPVRREVVQTIPNGAGLGAALFLSDPGFALGEALAAHARQVDLDLDPEFHMRYIDALAFSA